MLESSKLQLTKSGSENNDQNPRETLGDITAGVNTIVSQVFTRQNGAGKRQERSEKLKKHEIIDTPQEVLKFRKGFVNGIEKTEDITEEKLKKIAEIGNELDDSQAFHFEKSDYGNIGVLTLGGYRGKFLHIAHPQDFNDKLTSKIQDRSLWKNVNYKDKMGCRCENTQDLVYVEAMPGGYAEDAGIVELGDKIKLEIGLRALEREKMQKSLLEILKKYCNDKGIEFKYKDDYMLLYMYLIGANGGYGKMLLNRKRFACFYLSCYDDCRGFHPLCSDDNYASLFFGSFRLVNKQDSLLRRD